MNNVLPTIKENYKEHHVPLSGCIGLERYEQIKHNKKLKAGFVKGYEGKDPTFD